MTCDARGDACRRLLVVATACIALLTPSKSRGQAFNLPGTQPIGSAAPASAQINHLFLPPEGLVPYGLPCITCHESSATPEATPLLRWRGSMMAHAARDPLFYAQLDLTNSDATVRPTVAGMADMCLRCHSPVGWLEGRSTNLHGLGFQEKDMFGVQCHVCHRMVDPALAAADPSNLDVTNILNGLTPSPGIPPTFGNGMYVMDTRQVRRGPYNKAMMPGHGSEMVGEGLAWTAVTTSHLHPAMDSPFHRSGNLCGTCHDVSNPADVLPGFTNADIQKGFPIERTWTEWRHSVFATRGEAGTCQACHMSGPLNAVGFGAVCEGGDGLGHINDVHVHDLTGGNAFVPQIIKYMKQRYADPAEVNFRTALQQLYPPLGADPFLTVDVTAIDEGVKRVARTLRRAAYLDAIAVSPNLTVRVTNRTGHKLPTGYPEGRRMWLNARFVGATGNLVAESGRYNAATGSLFHDQNLDGLAGPKSYDAVRYTNAAGSALGIGRPTKVWEARPEYDPGGGGASVEFHFALNNTYRMDNRIPPEGWSLTGYTNDRALPVIPSVYGTNGWQGDYGTSGGPTVNFDEFDYAIPAGTDRAELTLYYQTASREYVEALRDDNPNDPTQPASPTNLVAGGYNRGTLLHEAWQQAGRSSPVPMARRVVAIADADGDGLSDGWEAQTGITAHPQGGFNDDPDGDGLSNWQEFQGGSAPLDGDDPTVGGVRAPVDVVLVLDISGSMNSPAPGTTTPKIQVLRDAVTLFLSTWNEYAVPGDRIGVVYFSSTSQQFGAGTLLKPFVSEWVNIRNDVQAKVASGWTALGAGLHNAIEGFDDPGRPRHVILFSNGMQNRSPMIVPDMFGDLVIRDQTSAENADVTGGSNVVLGGTDYFLPAGVKVHTIGIGVAGSNSAGVGWHKLLYDVAAQQDGKHNFITRAFDLEGVFLEDLVEALRGNTLQYVTHAELELGAGKEQRFAIPVNETATRFTAIVSWSGKAVPSPGLQLIRPDGKVEDLVRITRSGAFYKIITHFLSPAAQAPEDYGTWTLRVRGDADSAASFRVHVVVDEARVKYQFLVPGRRFRLGEPVRVTVVATLGDRLIKHLDVVTVQLERPRTSVGTLLAASGHRLRDTTGLPSDLISSPFARKLHAAFQDKSWSQRLTAERSTHRLRDDGTNGDDAPGDGIYSAILHVPEIPGHHALAFHLVGHTAAGFPIQREERRSIIVLTGPVDADRSGVRVRRVDTLRYLTFTPRDRARNVVGPGYASQFVVRASGVPLRVEDNLDGSYRALLPPGVAADSVSLTLDGQSFLTGPVREAGIGGILVWLIALLLLALVLVLVYRVVRGATV